MYTLSPSKRRNNCTDKAILMTYSDGKFEGNACFSYINTENEKWYSLCGREFGNIGQHYIHSYSDSAILLLVFNPKSTSVKIKENKCSILLNVALFLSQKIVNSNVQWG